MKRIYNCIFILFHFSFIFSIKILGTHSVLKKVSKCLLIVFNVYVTFLFTVILVSYPSKSGLSITAIANIIITITMLTFRWILCLNLAHFKNIANSLRATNVTKCPIFWLRTWAFASTGIQIVLLIYKLSTIIGHSSNGMVILGFKIEEPFVTIINSSHSTTVVVSLTMAINTFSIFYVTVCHQMRFEILNFMDKLSPRHFIDFEPLMESYFGISKMVERIDDAMSFPVFCYIIFSSVSMYDLIAMALRPQFVFSSGELIYTVCFFFITLQSFLAMTVAASLVGEASQKVCKEVKNLSPESLCAAIQLQRFISMTESDLCLTVWKILPIRRNFILAALGAMFTYILLLESIKF